MVGAGVTISNPTYPYAVYRHTGATTFFVIENNGTIQSTAGGGVFLGPRGAITNAHSASIVAHVDAIKITGGAGTVVNYGSIASTGTTGAGVYLNSGGSVTNAATASISGAHAVGIRGGLGIVINNGNIAGGIFDGVSLDSGGTVSNAASGSISGQTAISITGGAGMVVNYGSIGGVTAGGGGGVYLAFGGSVSNASSASIAGAVNAGTVVNYGSIASIRASGLVTNGVTASIMDGVSVGDGTVPASLVNAGRISGGGVSVVDNLSSYTPQQPITWVTNSASGSSQQLRRGLCETQCERGRE